jgi:hypothetical protein
MKIDDAAGMTGKQLADLSLKYVSPQELAEAFRDPTFVIFCRIILFLLKSTTATKSPTHFSYFFMMALETIKDPVEIELELKIHAKGTVN